MEYYWLLNARDQIKYYICMFFEPFMTWPHAVESLALTMTTCRMTEYILIGFAFKTIDSNVRASDP